MRIVVIASLLNAFSACKSTQDVQPTASLREAGAQPAVPATIQTIDDFEALLAPEAPVLSEDEIFAKLGISLPQFVLMFHSRSLQEASFESPRVIQFMSSFPFSRLFVAYNGSPSQRGFDRIELLQFNEAEASFEAAEVHLVPGARARLTRNPQSCEACHGQPLRPIWNPYPVWPGAYDNIDKQPVPEKASTKKAFANFLEASSTKGRYRHLPKSGIPGDPGPYFTSHSRELTAHFGDYINSSTAHGLASTRYFSEYSYAAAAIDRNCPDLESFIPVAIRDKFASPLQKVVDDVDARMDRFFQEELKRSAMLENLSANDQFKSTDFSVVTSSQPQTYRSHRSKLRYLFERDGRSLAPLFSADFERSSYRVGFSYFSLDAVLPPETKSMTCDGLKAASLKALNELAASGADPIDTGNSDLPAVVLKGFDASDAFGSDLEGRAYKFIAERCMKCHTSAGPGPAIPFADRSALRTALKGTSLRALIEQRMNLPAANPKAMPINAPIEDEILRKAFFATLQRVENS